MKKHVFILVFMTAVLAMQVACSPNSIVQANTPGPVPPAGTPAPPAGVIDIPGAKINIYAPGPNPNSGPASFWLGLWHGIISPFTLLASWLGRETVAMYEVRNDGRLYNLGFFLGVLVMPAVLGIFFGGRR